MVSAKQPFTDGKDVKFLFINPPYERLKGLTPQNAPLGLLYLATVLHRAGYDARVYDGESVFGKEKAAYEYTNIGRTMSHSTYVCNLKDDDHPAWRDMRVALAEHKPSIVGIGMMTAMYSSCKRVVEIVRETLPDALILAGGVHVTVLKEKALENMPEVDVGFVGEAEESILEFVDKRAAGEDWTSVKGLLYRKDGELVFSGPRGRIDDLDALPIPDRSLLVSESKYDKVRLAAMIASRGCPFQCAFCASVPLWGRKVKLRSPESVLKEIAYLVDKYKITSFSFCDDTFTTNKEAIIRFCQLIHEKYGSRRFKWTCLTNFNCVDDRLLYWLRKAGCKSLSIGIESGSDRILKLIKKGITTDQVRRGAKIVKKHGFWLQTFFMVGIPYETEEDIRKTIDFIKEIKPDSIHLCTFTPHPGTELYEYVVARGQFNVDENFSIYDHVTHHSMENFFVQGMSRERYNELVNEILELSTEMSKVNSIRKIMLVLDRLNWEKIKRRLKRLL